MASPKIKILLLIFLVATVFAGALVFKSGKSQKPLPSFAATLRSPLPSIKPTPFIVTETSEVISPDGKVKLMMYKKRIDAEITWTFSIGDKTLFRETLPTSTTLSIPYNVFSPDNKYIFLKSVVSGVDNYIVLSTNKNSSDQESPNLEIASLFNKKYPNYKITDVTGWGGTNLIIINTNKEGGTTGPSFWFDVPSKSFIQLSNRFN